jgi:polyhydroxyalkanoate synthesis regulator phasin
MSAAALAPNLQDLHDAEVELVCADQGISSPVRREVEMKRWQARIDELKAQIARIEESF